MPRPAPLDVQTLATSVGILPCSAVQSRRVKAKHRTLRPRRLKWYAWFVTTVVLPVPAKALRTMLPVEVRVASKMSTCSLDGVAKTLNSDGDSTFCQPDPFAGFHPHLAGHQTPVYFDGASRPPHCGQFLST